jgi:D-alanine-D-alanine ligase
VLIGESGLWNLMPEDYWLESWPSVIHDRSTFAEMSGSPLQIALQMKAMGVEVVVLGLHGRGGEDGSIQGFLETAGFAYTGPGVRASALAIDKIGLKRILIALGIPTAPYDVIRRHETRGSGSLEAVMRRILAQLGSRIVVKAPSLGSSVHVYMPRTQEEAIESARQILEAEDRVLVEQLIEGDEFTVPVLGTRESPHPLPVIAIKPKLAGWFDHKSKYLADGADEIVPAPIARPLARTLQDLAVRVHQVIGARGITRTDFIVNRQGNPYILELNTLPGMTGTSLVPKSAHAAGITMPELVEELIVEARQA